MEPKDVKLVLQTPDGKLHEIQGYAADVLIVDGESFADEAFNALLVEFKTRNPRLFGCAHVSIDMQVREEDEARMREYFDRLRGYQEAALYDFTRSMKATVQLKHGPRDRWGQCGKRDRWAAPKKS